MVWNELRNACTSGVVSEAGLGLRRGVLNKEVCGSNYDPGNECEHGRKQQNVEDEADHLVRSPYSEPPLPPRGLGHS